MKIPIGNVQVGRFFVKSYQVREITKEIDWDVQYRSYELATGEPYEYLPGQCSKEHITRWAEREATPEEIARMKREKATEVQIQLTNDYVRKFFDAIPDELLMQEVRRRGLDKWG